MYNIVSTYIKVKKLFQIIVFSSNVALYSLSGQASFSDFKVYIIL